MTLLVSNPPRRTRKLKKNKRRRARKAHTAPTRRRRRRRMRRNPPTFKRTRTVKRRRRRSARRSFNAFIKRKRRSSGRRRSSRRGLGKLAGGFIPSGVLESAGAGVAGFVGVHFLVDKIATLAKLDQIKTGNGRIAAKAGAALLAAFIAKKVGASSSIANGIAIGGLTAVGADLWNKFSGKPLAGLGVIDIDGLDSYPAAYEIQMSGMDDDDGVSGYADDGMVAIQ
jgi:hypothetical protein